MAKQLLIDGDLLLYRFACSNEHKVNWDEETTSEWIDATLAIYDLDRYIQKIIAKMKRVDLLWICLTSRSFRYDILPSYKANRKKGKKPTLLGDLRKHVCRNYPHKIYKGLEADDILGILATRYPDEAIIASTDKDLLQIPGYHYNWAKDKKEVISEEQADRFFYIQTLTGDTTDNYKGCPGIGPVKAARIIDDAKDDPWGAIVETYESKGLTEKDALIQARLARILRCTDYDFEKGEPILWKPTDIRCSQ